MPFKIDVQTNINDYELTLERCSEIITVLKETYQNIRKEMYAYFLGLRSLKKALLFVLVLFAFYFFTEDLFFLYLMPVSVGISMIFSMISAEYITSQSRKEIHHQLQHYIKKRETLLRNQKIKV